LFCSTCNTSLMIAILEKTSIVKQLCPQLQHFCNT